MKIVNIQRLGMAEVQVVRYARFPDQRGYFSEHFRQSDFNKELPFLAGVSLVQCNESFSRQGTVRGLHLQWSPYVGKLVRTVHGHMVDLFLDIRKGSPSFGKVLAHDMPADHDRDHNEWIWVPPGFAHGNFFLKDTVIEYFCTGEYNPACEAGISPLAKDLDWSACQPSLKRAFHDVAFHTELISAKDKAGLSLAAWERDERSRHFPYGPLSQPTAARRADAATLARKAG